MYIIFLGELMIINKALHLTKIFFHLSFKVKVLTLASFFLLGFFRILILMSPFRFHKVLMGKEMKESPEILNKKQYNKAAVVGWVVNKCSKYTPWQSKCFVRALTAQFILRLLHIPNTLYLGVSKDGPRKLKAHAWLRCGELCVTGAIEKEKYKCISFYSWL